MLFRHGLPTIQMTWEMSHYSCSLVLLRTSMAISHNCGRKNFHCMQWLPTVIRWIIQSRCVYRSAWPVQLNLQFLNLTQQYTRWRRKIPVQQCSAFVQDTIGNVLWFRHDATLENVRVFQLLRATRIFRGTENNYAPQRAWSLVVVDASAAKTSRTAPRIPRSQSLHHNATPPYRPLSHDWLCFYVPIREKQRQKRADRYGSVQQNDKTQPSRYLPRWKFSHEWRGEPRVEPA